MRELTWKELLKLKWKGYLAFLLIFAGVPAICALFIAKERPDFIWLAVLAILVVLLILAIVIRDNKRQLRKCLCGELLHSVWTTNCPVCGRICKCGGKLNPKY